MTTYTISCTCGSVEATLEGSPRVKGHCHCGDCRELLNIPYHSVTAWEKHQFSTSRGQQHLAEYQHPRLTMKRVYCKHCGETLYNTNGMDWRVVSQHLIRRCYDGTLPEDLASLSHFFYDRRIVDVDDDLPKRS